MMKKKIIIPFLFSLLFFFNLGMNGTKTVDQQVATLLDLCVQKVTKIADWQEEQLPFEILKKIASAQLLMVPKPSLIKTISTSYNLKIYNPVFAEGSIFYKSPSIGHLQQDHIYRYEESDDLCLCIKACEYFQGLIKSIIVNPSDDQEVIYALNGNVICFHCKTKKNKVIALTTADILDLQYIEDSVWAVGKDGIVYRIKNKKYAGSICPENSIPVGICADKDNKPIISYLNGSIKKIIDDETTQEITRFNGRITGCTINPKKIALLLALDSSLVKYDLNKKSLHSIGNAPDTLHFKQCLYIDDQIAITVDMMGDIFLWDLKYECAYPIETKRLIENRPNVSRVAYQDGQLAYDDKLVSIEELKQFIDLSLPKRAKILKEQKSKKAKDDQSKTSG